MPPSESNDVTIRPIGLDDAAQAAMLATELGYPAAADEISARIALLNQDVRHTVLVAVRDGKMLGWIDISVVFHLQAAPYAEIGGLVVSATERSQGIGRKLLRASENWAAGRGLSRVVVRSRITRERAHHFYQREGYATVKTSLVFEKLLNC
jgi:GNAT superfamily N-acetyltransferase